MMGLPVPTIALELPSYQRKENYGADETFFRITRALARPMDRTAHVTANLIGPTALGFRHRDDVTEIKRLLERMGVEVGVVAPLETGKWVTTGKGRNATTTFELTSSFVLGDDVIVRGVVEDESGNPVPDATVNVGISGPESAGLTSAPTDAAGVFEVTWKTSAPRASWGSSILLSSNQSNQMPPQPPWQTSRLTSCTSTSAACGVAALRGVEAWS